MASLPFLINDCTIAPLATGVKARTLLAFRERLETVPAGCIYFHFWIGRLRTAYEYKEHHNDFSHWVHKALHDDILAERIELLDPTMDDLETLRAKLIELIDQRIDEIDTIPFTLKDEQFHFINSKIIVFKTDQKIEHPNKLVHLLPELTRSSIFYHFIDSRRRTAGNRDDLSIWLESFGDTYKELIDELKGVDPYFISLSDLQEKLILLINKFFIKE